MPTPEQQARWTADNIARVKRRKSRGMTAFCAGGAHWACHGYRGRGRGPGRTRCSCDCHLGPRAALPLTSEQQRVRRFQAKIAAIISA